MCFDNARTLLSPFLGGLDRYNASKQVPGSEHFLKTYQNNAELSFATRFLRILLGILCNSKQGWAGSEFIYLKPDTWYQKVGFKYSSPAGPGYPAGSDGYPSKIDT